MTHMFTMSPRCEDRQRDNPSQRPSTVERDSVYLAMWNSRDQYIVDAMERLFPAFYNRHGGTNQMIWPGCQQFIGTHCKFHESAWIVYNEQPDRRNRLSMAGHNLERPFNGALTVQGWDSVGRKLIFNTTAVLGGIDDIMILAMVPLLEGWGDQDKNQRLSWHYPVLIRFRFERGLEEAMRFYRECKQRMDGGGRRIVKLEHSTREIPIADEDIGGDNRYFGQRMTSTQGIDWLTRPIYVKWGKGAQDRCKVMGTAAVNWNINHGKDTRRFNNGITGKPFWKEEFCYGGTV